MPVIDTDLGGCFNMCLAVSGGMRERRFGRIVNMSSINGQQGQFGQSNYAAAKAGILGFTKALALEAAAHGITVNAVAPGSAATDMVAAVSKEILKGIVARIPVGRLGRPEEIARAVLFLVADEAGSITGSTLSVNGGQHDNLPALLPRLPPCSAAINPKHIVRQGHDLVPHACRSDAQDGPDPFLREVDCSTFSSTRSTP